MPIIKIQILPAFITVLNLVKQTSATLAMPLLNLPNELLQDITEYLKSERDINAVARANRRLYRLLDSYLYRYNARQSRRSAMLWAARHDQEATAQRSLRESANIQATDNDNIKAPLLVVAEKGHKQIVKLLLDKGANVNAQSGYYGNTLQAASKGGHEAVVQLLLDKGAEVNAQGGVYSNALQAASKGGHEAVAQLLLNKGAEVNAQGGLYGNALSAASKGGYEAVVHLLLDKGAEINAQGLGYDNAIRAASQGGHEAVVQLLLNNGTDVNARDRRYGNAPQAASKGGHEVVVKLLKA
jgi:ankyrin repeat protein